MNKAAGVGSRESQQEWEDVRNLFVGNFYTNVPGKSKGKRPRSVRDLWLPPLLLEGFYVA